IAVAADKVNCALCEHSREDRRFAGELRWSRLARRLIPEQLSPRQVSPRQLSREQTVPLGMAHRRVGLGTGLPNIATVRHHLNTSCCVPCSTCGRATFRPAWLAIWKAYGERSLTLSTRLPRQIRGLRSSSSTSARRSDVKARRDRESSSACRPGR